MVWLRTFGIVALLLVVPSADAWITGHIADGNPASPYQNYVYGQADSLANFAQGESYEFRQDHGTPTDVEVTNEEPEDSDDAAGADQNETDQGSASDTGHADDDAAPAPGSSVDGGGLEAGPVKIQPAEVYTVNQQCSSTAWTLLHALEPVAHPGIAAQCPDVPGSDIALIDDVVHDVDAVADEGVKVFLDGAGKEVVAFRVRSNEDQTTASARLNMDPFVVPTLSLANGVGSLLDSTMGAVHEVLQTIGPELPFWGREQGSPREYSGRQEAENETLVGAGDAADDEEASGTSTPVEAEARAPAGSPKQVMLGIRCSLLGCDPDLQWTEDDDAAGGPGVGDPLRVDRGTQALSGGQEPGPEPQVAGERVHTDPERAGGDGPRRPAGRGVTDVSAILVPAAPAVHGWSVAFLGMGLAAAAAWLLWTRLASLMPLFSRIEPEQLQQHPKRREILELVRAHPGIHQRELRRRLRLARGTASHHLAKLEAGGLLVARLAGGYKCYTVPGQVDRTVRDAFSVVRTDVARGILRQALRGTTVSEAGASVDAGLALVHYHLRRLREAELVYVERGKVLQIRATAKGRTVARLL